MANKAESCVLDCVKLLGLKVKNENAVRFTKRPTVYSKLIYMMKSVETCQVRPDGSVLKLCNTGTEWNNSIKIYHQFEVKDLRFCHMAFV